VKTKLKGLIALLSAAVLLTVALVLLITTPDTGGEEEGEYHTHGGGSAVSESDTPVQLLSRQSDEIDYIVLQNANIDGKFTIKRNSVAGTLEIKELSGVAPLYSDFIEYVWYYGSEIGANYSLDVKSSGQKLSSFGLEKPIATLTVHFKDKTKSVLYVGNEVVQDEGIYFACFDNFDTVYAVPLHDAILQGAKYFIDYDILGLASGEETPVIGRIEIKLPKEKQSIVLEPCSVTDRSDQNYGKDYAITKPHKAVIDDVNVTSLVTELSNLTAMDIAAVKPTKAEDKKYGFSKDSTEIKLQYSGVDRTIVCGYKNDSNFYVKADGSDVIYVLEPSAVPVLANPTLDVLKSSSIRTYSIDALSKISVRTQDKLYSFSVERKSLTEDEDDGYFEYRAYKDGTEININYYKELLRVLSNGHIMNSSTEKTGKQPVVTVEAEYFDNFKRQSDVIEFYEAPSRRYLCTVNGTAVGQVTSIWLNSFIDTAEKAE
jgi:hypothetical protein